jgi:hypothetical protein
MEIDLTIELDLSWDEIHSEEERHLPMNSADYSADAD